MPPPAPLLSPMCSAEVLDQDEVGLIFGPHAKHLRPHAGKSPTGIEGDRPLIVLKHTEPYALATEGLGFVFDEVHQLSGKAATMKWPVDVEPPELEDILPAHTLRGRRSPDLCE